MLVVAGFENGAASEPHLICPLPSTRQEGITGLLQLIVARMELDFWICRARVDDGLSQGRPKDDKASIDNGNPMVYACARRPYKPFQVH